VFSILSFSGTILFTTHSIYTEESHQTFNICNNSKYCNLRFSQWNG